MSRIWGELVQLRRTNPGTKPEPSTGRMINGARGTECKGHGVCRHFPSAEARRKREAIWATDPIRLAARSAGHRLPPAP